MNSEDLSTIDAELIPLAPAFGFLELSINDKQGRRVLPFLTNQLEFQVNGQDCRLEVAKGEVHLGTGAEQQTLALGVELPIAGGTLQVVDLRTLPPYWLVGLSEEVRERRWAFHEGDNLIGRAGKRVNHATLSHPSISRAHAKITVQTSRVKLVVQSSALTALDNQQLKQGQNAELSPGQVLQLGELHFRWKKEERALLNNPKLLRLNALGVSRTWVDGREVQWHSENARDLLFWLASYEGAPLSVARVLEEYWPDRPVLRQRKNLSHVLNSLHAELGMSGKGSDLLIERTPDTLRLAPDRIEGCDFWDLRKTTRIADSNELCQAFLGSFLPHNERPWARAKRRELFLSWLGAVEQSPLSPQGETQVLDLITQVLRQNDFEYFVYEKVCQLAQKLKAESHVAMWLEELKERDSSGLSEPDRKPIS